MSIGSRDLTIRGEVGFGANEDHGDFVLARIQRIEVLDAADAVIEIDSIVERFSRSNRIREDETAARFDLQIAHGTELIRSGGVEDVEDDRSISNHCKLAVIILNGGIYNK